MAKSALIHTKNIDPATLTTGPITIEAEVVQTENDPADLVDATGTVHGDGVLTSILTMPDTANDYPYDLSWVGADPTMTVVGNSITFGVGAGVTTNGFAYLFARDIGIDTTDSAEFNMQAVSATNIGDQLFADFPTRIFGANKRDYLLIDGPVNDGRTTADEDPSTLFRRLFAIVYRAIDGGYDAEKIILCNGPYFMPDAFSGTYGQQQATYEAYVAAFEKVARIFGCRFADTYGAMRTQWGIPSAFYGSDAVHPNDAGHRKMADACLESTIPTGPYDAGWSFAVDENSIDCTAPTGFTSYHYYLWDTATNGLSKIEATKENTLTFENLAANDFKVIGHANGVPSQGQKAGLAVVSPSLTTTAPGVGIVFNAAQAGRVWTGPGTSDDTHSGTYFRSVTRATMQDIADGYIRVTCTNQGGQGAIYFDLRLGNLIDGNDYVVDYDFDLGNVPTGGQVNRYTNSPAWDDQVQVGLTFTYNAARPFWGLWVQNSFDFGGTPDPLYYFDFRINSLSPV